MKPGEKRQGCKPTRMTNQKIKIVEYLKSVKTHPTAEQVYKKVKNDLPAISLATVYRNLNAMADNEEIIRFEINKEFRFDADTCCHQHAVCTNCSRIFDIFEKEVSEFAMKRFSLKGFRPDCVRIIYYGLCKDCKGEQNEKQKDCKRGHDMQ